MLMSCSGKSQNKSSERWALASSAESGGQALFIFKKGREMEEKAQVTSVTFTHHALSRVQSYGHA